MTRAEFKCDCGETFWRREGLEYHRVNKLCETSAVMGEIAQVEGQQNAYAPSRPVEPIEHASAPRPNAIAASICYDAADLINGDRSSTHGSVETTHANIADAWNAILRAKWRRAECIDPPPPTLDALDVLNMLEALKIMRRYSGSFNLDDFIDGVGYAALAGQVAAERAR